MAEVKERKENRTLQVDYSKIETPADYVCEDCGAIDCKLWRESHTFNPKLLCGACVAKEEGKDISFDESGMYMSEMGRTDQMGIYLPAVPTKDGIGFWAYTLVPPAGVDWWKKLPTYQNNK